MNFTKYSLSGIFLFFVFVNTAYAFCYSEVVPSTPSADFTVHGDGTVTHNNTSLMWKVCSEEQVWNNNSCTGGEFSVGSVWSQALQRTDALNAGGGYAGYTTWRLPNISELASIVEVQCDFPTINAEIFSNAIASFYWTSTPSPDASQGFGHPDIPGDENSWIVVFTDGSEMTQSRFNSARVRLVRDVP